MSDKKYILVTGGAGYIGSHTVVELLKDGFTPIIIDDFRNAKKSVIERLNTLCKQDVIFYEASCTDSTVLSKISDNYKIWGVIHFAADKAVGESVADPLKYYENNVSGLVSILRWMTQKGIDNLVFSSSCTVYGEPEIKTVTEETPKVTPSSPYGKTKLMCEQILEDTAHAYPQLNIIALRYFNPIGAHESGLIGEEPQGIPNNLLPFITQTAKRKRDCLSVFGKDYPTKDGTCVRDYIYVVDLADAHVKSLNYINNNPSIGFDVFNIGTGTGTTVLECIEAFEEVANLKLNWKFADKREGDVVEIYADVTKAKETLNWIAKYNVKQAIASAWKWEQNI